MGKVFRQIGGEGEVEPAARGAAVHGPGGFDTAGKGFELVEGLAVVVSPDGVLVVPKTRVQEVRAAVAELKLAATPLGIRKLELGPTGGRCTFLPQPTIDPMSVIRMIQSQPRVYAMEGPEKIRIRLEMPDATSRLRTAKGLLAVLAKG